MVITKAELETVCGITSTLPENQFFEIAFAGKSNVGKSSLINGLINRKSLARTSQSPGKTQTINFYNIGFKKDSKQVEKQKEKNNIEQISSGEVFEIYDNSEKLVYFVDLPGYGYAKVSAEIREKWGKLIERYLNNSQKLIVVFLLIDIRHVPSENDKIMYDWIISNGYKPVIIATKLDKIKKTQKDKSIKTIKEKLKVEKGTVVIPFSAETKQGKEEIWQLIETTIAAQ